MMAEIVCSLRFEALHHWPDAEEKEPTVGFLTNPHRHEFHVRCWKVVSHGDRDVEFIKLKRDIKSYVERHAGIGNDRSRGIDLGACSCEMLAEELIHAFLLSRCEVLEDGENGAVLYSHRYREMLNI